MNLRKLCLCGHVRGSHSGESGGCSSCDCRLWTPAYPVYDGALPAGVDELLLLRATGLSLVVCTHAVEHRLDRPPGTLGPSDAGADSWLCSFCRGDVRATDGWRRPVKRLVFAPAELTLL